MARRRRPPRPGGRPRGRRRRQPPKAHSLPQGPVIPDTDLARFEEEVRRDVERVMASKKKDLGLVESERLLDRILDQHPEHAELFRNAADHVVEGDENSPFVHVGLHRVVEERVVSREMARLDPAKPWHDAVHDGLELVSEELFGVDEEPAEESA